MLERLVLPEMGNRKAEKITTAELARLHSRMKDHPYQANRMLAVVGSLYSFAGKRHILPLGLNPVRGIDKYPEKGRERFLSIEELNRLGDAVREGETIGLPYAVDKTSPKAKHAPKERNRRTVMGPHAAAALRLLLFTGARLREILHLKWEHVDIERGLLLFARQQDGQKGDRAERTRLGRAVWSLECWRLRHRGRRSREAARRFETAVASGRETSRAQWRSHPRLTPHARELRRRGRLGAANHWQAARPRYRDDNGAVRAPRR
jgi:integrase